VEVGIPTVCAETCVGRLRYIGVVFYDPDRVLEAASTPDDKDLYRAQREVFLDPFDPEVIAAAEECGIPQDWIAAAQRSPIWALINRFEVALPLHPEYRTMPMVWYIPPLSPVVDVLSNGGHDAEDAHNLFGAIDALRIPIGYLAELFTAGDATVVRNVLARLAAMRSYMRDVNLGQEKRPEIADAVGMSGQDIEDMYRLLALAKYDERYVIPPAHGELGDLSEKAHELEELACSLDYDGGPGMGGSGPFGESSGGPAPIAVENFRALRTRQTSDLLIDPGDGQQRVNLLNWDGKGLPSDVMPPRPSEPAGDGPGATP
jgi:nitrate reductase beta subunit